ncbi:MAG: DUF441 domain-containing protein [Bacillota bacterium]
MWQQAWLLFAVLALGVISRNNLLISASGILLVFLFSGYLPAVRFFEEKGVELGILILTVSVLAPLATGSAGLADIRSLVTGRGGVAALIAGMLAAYLTGQGVSILRLQPEIVMGLAIGSILGTAFLGGVPAGPLVAAGFAAVLLRVFRQM